VGDDARRERHDAVDEQIAVHPAVASGLDDGLGGEDDTDGKHQQY